MTTPYKYHPLTVDRSIRLLELKKRDDALHGFEVSLTETNLNDKPYFKALSYTWGIPYTEQYDNPEVDVVAATSNKYEIACGPDQVPQVSENLFDVLDRLVRNAGEGGLAPMWIDALCINQADTREKSLQVLLMGDIYSSATQVVIWLGKAGPDPRFLWIHESSGVEECLREACLSENQGQTPSKESLRLAGVASMEEWQDAWRRYHRFYRRQRYFRRAWIIQETALAREIIVLCGNHTLDWTRLVIIGNLLHVSKLAYHWTTLGEQIVHARGWSIGNEVRQLHMYRTDHVRNGGLPMELYRTPANYMCGQQDQEANDETTQSILKAFGALGTAQQKEYAYFVWILDQFGNYHATDKRDHIFAAVAFCQPFFKKAGIASPIIPDYSMTVQGVFTAVTAGILAALPVLSILSFVDQRRKKIGELPSWVPDFSIAFANRPFVIRGFSVESLADVVDQQTGLTNEGAVFTPIYSASGTTEPPPDGTPLARAAGNDLHLSGAACDTITDVSPAHSDGIADFRYTPYLEFCLKQPSIYEATFEPREEALWRTLVGNFDDSTFTYPAHPRVGQLFRQHIVDVMTAHYTEDTSVLDGDFSAMGRSVIPTRVEVTFNVMTTMLRALTALGTGMAYGAGADESQEALVSRATNSILSQGISEAELEFTPMIGSGMSLPDRRLYSTSRGYLGLGPSTTAVGDEVWVLKGGRVPFVLRRVGDPADASELRLVGETYLPGFMDGEMLQSSGDRGSGIDFRDIILS